MNKIINEIIGWYGAVAVLVAYALISLDIISTSNFSFYILNSTGALGLMYISLKKKVYQPAVLYIIWTIIGLVGLIRLF